eukprot:EG_transcript_20851
MGAKACRSPHTSRRPRPGRRGGSREDRQASRIQPSRPLAVKRRPELHKGDGVSNDIRIDSDMRIRTIEEGAGGSGWTAAKWGSFETGMGRGQRERWGIGGDATTGGIRRAGQRWGMGVSGSRGEGLLSTLVTSAASRSSVGAQLAESPSLAVHGTVLSGWRMTYVTWVVREVEQRGL